MNIYDSSVRKININALIIEENEEKITILPFVKKLANNWVWSS